jgi:hypothetical protein
MDDCAPSAWAATLLVDRRALLVETWGNVVETCENSINPKEFPCQGGMKLKFSPSIAQLTAQKPSCIYHAELSIPRSGMRQSTELLLMSC